MATENINLGLSQAGLPSTNVNSPPSHRPSLAGRCCSDWSSFPNSILILGCLSISIYEYVKGDYFFASTALGASLIGGVLCGRVNCLKPMSNLAKSQIVLSQTVGSLSHEEQKLDQVIEKGSEAQQAANWKQQEVEQKFEAEQLAKSKEIEALKTLNIELAKKSESWETLYNGINARYREAQAQIREHVEVFTQTTNALMLVNTSLKGVETHLNAPLSSHDLDAIHDADEGFKAENATMEDLLQQFKLKLTELQTVKEEMEGLAKSLALLVQREADVKIVEEQIADGQKKLDEIQERLVALVPVLEAKASLLKQRKAV